MERRNKEKTVYIETVCKEEMKKKTLVKKIQKQRNKFRNKQQTK